MNRAERRRLQKQSKDKPKPGGSTKYQPFHEKSTRFTGKEIMEMQTAQVRENYALFMNIFLVTIHDQFGWRSYKNHMGKLDRLERNVRKRVLAMDDVASFDAFMRNVQEVHEVLGVTIQPDMMNRSSLNTSGMEKNTYTYTTSRLKEMAVSSQVTALIVYFVIFLLEVHKMTGYVSAETGDSPMDRLIDRLMNNVDCVGDKYAQMEFHDYADILRDELKFTVKRLDD